MIHYSEMMTQLPPISSFGHHKINAKTPIRDGKRITEERFEVYRVACSFAIHTSKYEDDKNKQFSVPYIWTLNIKGSIFYGRTIHEFTEATELLRQYYDLSPKKRLRLYVHRLVAEFQNIRKYFNVIDSFSAEKRKPYYVVFDNGIELYDAHAMTDKSIENIAADLDIEYIADKNPNMKRSPVMKLDEDTLQHIISYSNVVYTLIEDELLQYKSIIKLPLTNTQRVRRHINKHCISDTSYMNKVRSLTMTYDEFLLLKRCFTGGYTFANPTYRNRVLEEVTSLDISSAYPSIITTELFPMSPFAEYEIESYAEFIEFVTDYQFCSAFDITLYNLESRYDDIFLLNPDQIHEGTGVNVRTLGGKVDSADKLTISLTNVDWAIFSQLYTFDLDKIVIERFMGAKAGYLPFTLVNSVLQLYRDKTELKGVPGKERQYKEAKVKLNSVYGMLVTDEIQRNKVSYNKGSWDITSFNTFEEQLEKDIQTLNDYNNKKSRTTFYGWGVWVTAYARKRLFNVILKTAPDFVYCDTDSVKILNYEKYRTVFENDLVRQKNRIDFAVAEHQNLGRTDFAPKSPIDNSYKIIGVFEVEHTYSKFKALRSKQYVGIKNGQLEVTCSGIPKKALATHLQSISKSDTDAINKFNYQLDIPAEATGIYTICFVDGQTNRTITDHDSNTIQVNIPSCVYYEPRGYSLISDDDFIKNTYMMAQGQIFTATY